MSRATGQQVGVAKHLAETKPELALLVGGGKTLDLSDIERVAALPGELTRRPRTRLTANQPSGKRGGEWQEHE